jgi:protein-tyrosine phosphatase
MKKVLFVCLGNICRSPLAEALFNHHVKEKGLQGKFIADSCGTAAYHIGEQPNSRSRANAKENGLIYSHDARQVQDEDFHEFDMIIPMDESNMSNLEKFDKGGSATIQLMRDYDSGYEGEDVPDPYFGGDQGFQEVYEMLDRSTESLLNKLSSTQNL